MIFKLHVVVLDSELASCFLKKFGYMNQSLDMERAIRKFQAFAGLEQTGKLSHEIINGLKFARRGCFLSHRVQFMMWYSSVKIVWPKGDN